MYTDFNSSSGWYSLIILIAFHDAFYVTFFVVSDCWYRIYTPVSDCNTIFNKRNTILYIENNLEPYIFIFPIFLINAHYSDSLSLFFEAFEFWFLWQIFLI